MRLYSHSKSKKGFTIVELIVVISVIAILASISIVGYGSWRNSVISTQIKNDLTAVASAMESARTFSNGYPTSLPSNVQPSENVTLTLMVDSDATSYCIDGVSSENTNLTFFIASDTKDKGALEGTCATRPNQVVPSVPTGLAVNASRTSSIDLSWDESTNLPIGYTAQCASDAGFIVGLGQSTQASTSTTVTGLDASTTHYCRVKATNAAGSSDWSTTISTNTTDQECSTTGQFGTYPICYAYDALPLASSIEGYWTSPPDGYLIEDGSAVSRTTYAELFASIGTTFGAGDGATTFNLPDSRGRVAVNRNTSDTEFDAIGERPGSKTEQLTTTQMPTHTHKLPWQQNGNDVSDYLGGSGAAYGLATSYNAATTYDPLEPVGGNDGHNNIQPSIVKTFAIKYRPSTGSESTLPTGTSIQGYWTSAPAGYLLENGSAVSRTTYSDLFAVTGTTYGVGNGTTTFNLPDSRGRASVNLSPTDTEFDAMGEKPGSKTEQLTIAQMPSHTHKVPYLASGNDVSDYLGGSGAGYGIAYNYTTMRSGTYDPLEPVGGGATHNNIQPSITRTFAIKYTAVAGSVEASPRGTSIQGYWTSAPAGYLLENGSAVSRTTYAALFAVIGTTYGAGNGTTTFNLPDSRGRVGVHKKSTDPEFDTMGEKYGEKSHVLTIAEMPTHTHKLTWQNNGNDVSDYLGGSGADYGIASTYNFKSGTYDLLEPVGGDGAHNEIQPSITKMFAIKF